MRGGRIVGLEPRGTSPSHRAFLTALLLDTLHAGLPWQPSPVIAQDSSVQKSEQQAVNTPYRRKRAQVRGNPAPPGLVPSWRSRVAGNPAREPRGAPMGLMQIMPAPGPIARSHRLGETPSIHGQHLAGPPPYPRQMYDRFGHPGFLSAYKRKAARYQNHFDRARLAGVEPALPCHPQHSIADGTDVARSSQPAADDLGLARRPLFARVAKRGSRPPAIEAAADASDASHERDFRATLTGGERMISRTHHGEVWESPGAEMCWIGSTRRVLNRKSCKINRGAAMRTQICCFSARVCAAHPKLHAARNFT